MGLIIKERELELGADWLDLIVSIPEEDCPNSPAVLTNAESSDRSISGIARVIIQ